MTRADPDELADDLGIEITVADGFDEAIAGLAFRYGWSGPVVVYDRTKVIDILMRQGATPEEALEHFYYNVIGSWVGEQTPIFMVTSPEEV